MSNLKALVDTPQKQRDRLAFIELQAWFTGSVSRKDVVKRFAIQTAAATRDLALYREIAPANLVIDPREKSYLVSGAFKPIFTYSSYRITTWLSQGFGDEEHVTWSTGIPCNVSAVLSQPRIEILAAVCRAIHQRRAIEIRYESLNRLSERVIAPFALHSNGQRWHARAFDRESGQFRDFVITRIISVAEIGSALNEELASEDGDWNRRVDLELVPHPNLDRKEPVLCDYDFDKTGVLRVKVRAALAGYTLRQWGVDCSSDHSGSPREFQLWLRNRQSLFGVPNLFLAPCYDVDI